MRRRFKGLVAIVIASAAIGGVLATPASADAPTAFRTTINCESTSGGTYSQTLVFPTPTWFHAQGRITHFNCVPGTLELAVEPLYN